MVLLIANCHLLIATISVWHLRVINVLYLGRVDYSIALELQQTLVRLVKEGRISHTLLLLEHPPVITLGRNAGAQNIVASREFLTANGVELHETDRGGDVTFHGPGQLVGYPIFDLRAFEPRIGAVDFVRKLEEVSSAPAAIWAWSPSAFPASPACGRE